MFQADKDVKVLNVLQRLASQVKILNMHFHDFGFHCASIFSINSASWKS